MSSLVETKIIKKKPGQIIKHSTFEKDISDENFEHYIFQNVGATQIKFTNCNFSYTFWNDTYLRRCKFSNCNFTGARFSDSIIKDCDIKNCIFEYVRFFSTQLDVREIIKNLPSYTNLRRNLCRNLRSNAESLNDKDGARDALEKEINSSKDHYQSILWGRGEYYQVKYCGCGEKFRALLKVLEFFLSGCLWGHGEKPLYILKNIFIVLFLSTFFISCMNSLSFWTSLKISTEIFLGFETFTKDLTPPFYIYIPLVFLRYISLGLFVSSIIYKTRWR